MTKKIEVEIPSHTPAKWLINLQLLRFLAAIAVVFFHVGAGVQEDYPAWTNPFSLGFSGVDVFFVLSGYIMALTVAPEKGAWNFTVHRLARIVPLYWLLTLTLFGVAWIAPSLLNTTVANWGDLVKSLLFVPYPKPNGLTQPLLFLGWTLCYEMFFYAIYAFSILMVGRRRPGAEKVVVIAILMTLIALGRTFPSANALWKFYTDPLLAEFAFGMIICMGLKFWPTPRLGWIAPVVLLVAAVVLFFLLMGTPRSLSLGLPATAVVASFVLMPETRSSILWAFGLLGNASYSLYLVHPYSIQLPLKLAARLGSPAWTSAAAFVGAVAAIFVSLVLYERFEKPAQRLVKRFLLRSPEDPRYGTLDQRR